MTLPAPDILQTFSPMLQPPMNLNITITTNISHYLDKNNRSNPDQFKEPEKTLISLKTKIHLFNFEAPPGSSLAYQYYKPLKVTARIFKLNTNPQLLGVEIVLPELQEAVEKIATEVVHPKLPVAMNVFIPLGAHRAQINTDHGITASVLYYSQ